MSELVVRAALAAASWGCASALDVGSGTGRYRALVGHCATLDAYQAAPLSDHHRLGNLLDALPKIGDREYDLVYALDVVEHLERSDGLRMLEHMERIARIRVLLFTPNGFRQQDSPVKWQRHRSGWSASDLRARGYWVAVTDFDYGYGLESGAALWGALSTRA